MDSGRLGRVLGVGARQAAKTLVGAVDAATAPNPRDGRTERAGRVTRATRDGGVAEGVVEVPRRGVERGRAPAARRGVVEGGRRFGRAVWAPTARLGGVLWLEVTGMFFGLFALVAVLAAWRLREGVRGGAERGSFLVALGMAGLFGYFAVSSFVGARRRGRRR